MKWTVEEENLLQSIYPGSNWKDILKAFPGRNKAGIADKAFRLGLRSDNTRRCRYSHNKDFFAAPDAINSYWAGFIAADGNVNNAGCLTVSLHHKDKFHLYNFKRAINYTGDIKDYKRNACFGNYKFTQHKSTLLISSSHKVISDLNSNFCIVPNKTLILCPPNLFTEDCISSFIRGYIDGDGCISRSENKGRDYSLSCTSTKEMLDWICKHFVHYCNYYRHIRLFKRTNKNTYRFKITCRPAFIILKWIYQNSSSITRLDRKYKKYLELKRYYGR